MVQFKTSFTTTFTSILYKIGSILEEFFKTQVKTTQPLFSLNIILCLFIICISCCLLWTNTFFIYTSPIGSTLSVKVIKILKYYMQYYYKWETLCWRETGFSFCLKEIIHALKLQLNQEFFNIPFDNISFAVLISKSSLLKQCIPAKLTSLS